MSKAPDITAPIYGYNSHGLKHRASHDVLVWLDGEIKDAKRYQAEFNQIAVESDYSDYDNEICRHEQDGIVQVLEYVKRHLESRD